MEISKQRKILIKVKLLLLAITSLFIYTYIFSFIYIFSRCTCFNYFKQFCFFSSQLQHTYHFSRCKSNRHILKRNISKSFIHSKHMSFFGAYSYKSHFLIMTHAVNTNTFSVYTRACKNEPLYYFDVVNTCLSTKLSYRIFLHRWFSFILILFVFFFYRLRYYTYYDYFLYIYFSSSYLLI